MKRWLRTFVWLAVNPWIYRFWEWRESWDCPVCGLVAPSLWSIVRHVMIAEEREHLGVRELEP